MSKLYQTIVGSAKTPCALLFTVTKQVLTARIQTPNEIEIIVTTHKGNLNPQASSEFLDFLGYLT